MRREAGHRHKRSNGDSHLLHDAGAVNSEAAVARIAVACWSDCGSFCSLTISSHISAGFQQGSFAKLRSAQYFKTAIVLPQPRTWDPFPHSGFLARPSIIPATSNISLTAHTTFRLEFASMSKKCTPSQLRSADVRWHLTASTYDAGVH